MSDKFCTEHLSLTIMQPMNGIEDIQAPPRAYLSGRGPCAQRTSRQRAHYTIPIHLQNKKIRYGTLWMSN